MSNNAERFRKLFEEGRKRLSYFVQGAILEFTESMVARMEELEVSKSQLAERLGCKPSYITKVLQGGTNFTLESMVKIALALDSEITMSLRQKHTAPWREINRISVPLQPVQHQRQMGPLFEQFARVNHKHLNLKSNKPVVVPDNEQLSLTA